MKSSPRQKALFLFSVQPTASGAPSNDAPNVLGSLPLSVSEAADSTSALVRWVRSHSHEFDLLAALLITAPEEECKDEVIAVGKSHLQPVNVRSVWRTQVCHIDQHKIDRALSHVDPLSLKTRLV